MFETKRFIKSVGIEIKWGIIFSIVAKLWMLLEKLVGLHGKFIEKHALYTTMFAIPAIIIYVLALRDKKKNYYKGKMIWKEGFVSGLFLTAVITILVPLVQFIAHSYITPGYFENAINFAVESGKMELAEARKYFNINNYIIQSMLGSAVLGMITSAIVAFLLKGND